MQGVFWYDRILCPLRGCREKLAKSFRHDVTLASGGGVNKGIPSVNTSSPARPRVMTSAPVSHMVPGIRGIHRGTRRKCRDSESEQSLAT